MVNDVVDVDDSVDTDGLDDADDVDGSVADDVDADDVDADDVNADDVEGVIVVADVDKEVDHVYDADEGPMPTSVVGRELVPDNTVVVPDADKVGVLVLSPPRTPAPTSESPQALSIAAKQAKARHLDIIIDR